MGRRRWQIWIAAVAYAAPLLLLPLHGSEESTWVECARCGGQGEAGYRIEAECDGEDGPCRKREHHHHSRAPHHPGHCQVCTSLALGTGLLVPGGVGPATSPPESRFHLPDECAPIQTILPILSRGPPTLG